MMKMMAEILLLVLLAASLLEFSEAFGRDSITGNYNGNQRNNYRVLRTRLPKPRNPTEERRSQTVESADLCGRWDDWCSQSSANPVLQCCPGYACKCSVWNSNCKCRTKMFTGKWGKWVKTTCRIIRCPACQSLIRPNDYDVTSINF